MGRLGVSGPDPARPPKAAELLLCSAAGRAPKPPGVVIREELGHCSTVILGVGVDRVLGIGDLDAATVSTLNSATANVGAAMPNPRWPRLIWRIRRGVFSDDSCEFKLSLSKLALPVLLGSNPTWLDPRVAPACCSCDVTDSLRWASKSPWRSAASLTCCLRKPSSMSLLSLAGAMPRRDVGRRARESSNS